MQSFSLHPQLTNECIVLGALSTSQVLLFNGSTFPWFILVPQEMHGSSYIKEWHHLSPENQQAAFNDSMLLSQFLEAQYSPDKINIAALGNMVPQLHIHHIARFNTDAAWPAPIWGHPDKGQHYSQQDIADIIKTIQDKLPNDFKPA